jgi:hypothetical protein
MGEPTLGWLVSTWKDLVEIAGVAMGGVWAYKLFVEDRQRHPQATLTHNLTHRRLADGKLLLHLEVVIQNPGVMLLCLRSSFVRLQRVLPPPSEVHDVVANGLAPVPEGGRESEWRVIVERPQQWAAHEFEIEPGEAGRAAWDLVLEGDLESIEVYSYFQNERKRSLDIGWGLATLYDFTSVTPGTASKTVEAQTGKGGEKGNASAPVGTPTKAR